MPPVPAHTQIAVIGAGPVGVLAALQLARQGRQVLLIEARPQHAEIRDRRTLALSFNSVAAFQQAGVVLPEEETTPIVNVHISQQNMFGRTLLRAEDMGVAALGRTVDYALLMRACEAALAAQNVPVLWHTQVAQVRTLSHFAELQIEQQGRAHSLTADWVVLAEGGHLAEGLPGLQCHSYDYQQSALVTTLEFEQGNNGTAYERFADAGPFALLPYHHAYRLVWTRTPADALSLKNMPFEDFAAAFEAAFGNHLGRLKARGEAAVFPLQLKQLNKVYSGRVICIGNAAQNMTPRDRARAELGRARRAGAGRLLCGRQKPQQQRAGAAICRRPPPRCASHCGLHPQLGHAFRPPRRPAQIRARRRDGAARQPARRA